MVEIPLTQGKVAIVDDCDGDKIKGRRWYAVKSNRSKGRTFYAVCREPDGSRLYLHRFLMEAPPGVPVDHKNGDGLDCRHKNMRLSTHADNISNQWWKRDGAHRGGADRRGGKGVRYRAFNRGKPYGKWEARLKWGGRLFHIGTFDSEDAAVAAYQAELARRQAKE